MVPQHVLFSSFLSYPKSYSVVTSLINIFFSLLQPMLFYIFLFLFSFEKAEACVCDKIGKSIAARESESEKESNAHRWRKKRAWIMDEIN